MTQLTQTEEIALMQRISRSDQVALAELYDQFAARVYGMTVRVLQNPTLAEEAMQDTFMKVWRGTTRWNPERGSLSTWLLTIARYTAIDRLREEKRQTPWTAISIEDFLTGVTGGSDKPYWVDTEALKDLIQRLPEEQIEAIELAYFFGMSHSEIAEYLDRPLGTVKSRIRDGLKTLRGLWLRLEQ